MRNRLTAHWKNALWLVVLVRLCLPATPESPFSLFNWIKLPTSTPSIHVRAISSSSEALILDEARSSVTVPAVTSVATTSFSWKTWVGIIWACGVVFLAGCAFFNNYRFSARLSRHRQFTDPAVLDLLEDCKSEMGVLTPVTVVVSSNVGGPALFGFVRPRLLLPEETIKRFTHEELRLVLLHELAHVKRLDIPVNWLMSVVLVLNWFNPILWLVFRRIRADREIACDEMVLTQAKGKNGAYGAVILKVLETCFTPKYHPGLAGILEESGRIKERIELITRAQQASSRLTGAICLSLLGLIGLTAGASDERFSGEHIVNGSFEQGLFGWNTNLTSEFAIKLDDSRLPSTDGVRCVILGGFDIPGAILSQTVPVHPGRTYVLKFDSAATGAAARVGSFRVEITTASGVLLGSTSIVQPTTKPLVYEQQRVDFRVPHYSTEVKISFIDMSPLGGQAVDPVIDNVRLRQKRGL